MKTERLLSGFFVLLFLACGCAPDHDDPADILAAPAEKKSQLGSVDYEGYRDLIAGEHGKTTVVYIWATWCPPCVRSFPKLVELHRKYADRDVTVIGVNVDFAGNEGRVQSFLEKHEAEFKNVIVQTDDISDFVRSVNRSWSGAIPAVFLYDRSGGLSGSYLGGNALDQTKQALDSGVE